MGFNISHSDIVTLTKAKRQPGTLETFNLSVMVDDDFMAALVAGANWPLITPRDRKVLRTLPAAKPFALLVESTHAGH